MRYFQRQYHRKIATRLVFDDKKELFSTQETYRQANDALWHEV